MEDWKRVLWSDETKINRIGSDGKVYTWKKKGEPLSDRITIPSRLLSSMKVEIISWYRDVWGGMELGSL